MALKPNQVELLSPARNSEIAQQAILHGADAIYIGGPHFGARYQADNSVQDIAQLVTFAHRYYAKVFVTLNTILQDNELDIARQMIYQLYDAGVDALIIQDMGILALDIPPIELHASTQMDIRDSQKAVFLSDVGFSQLVLARELSLKQIQHIAQQVDASLEFFIHGALCVSYSGQCYISHATTGRSANRGECSQACRLPYQLTDLEGNIIANDKHLLSLKDNNQHANLSSLLQAGVRSFKIEGRYKDSHYVKNITAYYRQQLDQLFTEYPQFSPSSSGRTEHYFTPNPEKTFHRGSSDYFVNARHKQIAAFDSPKFVGQQIGQIMQMGSHFVDVTSSAPLHNGDGLALLWRNDVIGFRVNKVEILANSDRYRLFLNEFPQQLKMVIPPYPVYRNLDHDFNSQLDKASSDRRIAVSMKLSGSLQQLTLMVTSEEGVTICHTLYGEFQPANQPDTMRHQCQQSLAKLGKTIYYLANLTLDFAADQMPFVPNALINQLRRESIERLSQQREGDYCRDQRKASVEPAPIYPLSHLTYLANVYNQKAKAFYHKHGVQLIDSAYETNQHREDVALMITKHCLRFSFDLCPKEVRRQSGERIKADPLRLIQKGDAFILKFDCKACEMQVWGKLK